MTSPSFNVQREPLETGRFLRVLAELRPEDAASRAATQSVAGITDQVPDAGLITLKERSRTPLAQLFIERLRAYARPLADSRRHGGCGHAHRENAGKQARQ